MPCAGAGRGRTGNALSNTNSRTAEGFGVEDIRESPALAIIKLLEQHLAWVSYHDRFVPLLKFRHLMRTMQSVPLTPEQAYP